MGTRRFAMRQGTIARAVIWGMVGVVVAGGLDGAGLPQESWLPVGVAAGLLFYALEQGTRRLNGWYSGGG